MMIFKLFNYTFKRQGFSEMFKMIESDQVATLIVKDMSRLGRNYIEVGQLTKKFQSFCVVCGICKMAC